MGISAHRFKFLLNLVLFLFVSAIPLFGIEYQNRGTAGRAVAYIYQAFNCLACERLKFKASTA
jgi:hypothetical protein